MSRFLHRGISRLAVLAVLLLTLFPARAQQSSNQSEIADLERKASKGNYQAAFRLGEIYADGEGTSRDPQKARHWFEIAADNGYGPIDVANRYASGRGLPKDLPRAVYWYQRTGCQLAGYPLGLMYESGLGVAKDYAKAADCYRQGMERATHARLGLARLMAQGLGVPQDIPAAMKLYREAAEREIGGVAFEIAMNYVLGRGVPENPGEAARWWQISASYHDGGAAVNLARDFLEGTGVSRSVLPAYVWASLDSDITYSASSLRDELTPRLTPQQKTLGDQLIQSFQATHATYGAFYDSFNPVIYMSEPELRDAILQPSVDARFSLAYRLENGIGMHRDVPTAMDLYRQVVLQSGADLYTNLARDEEARGNSKVALQWFLTAAKAGSTDAQFRIGTAYFEGDGFEKDLSAACKWFILAADSNPAAPSKVAVLKALLGPAQFSDAQAQASEIRSSFSR